MIDLPEGWNVERCDLRPGFGLVVVASNVMDDTRIQFAICRIECQDGRLPPAAVVRAVQAMARSFDEVMADEDAARPPGPPPAPAASS